jgi:hypothetical protein
MGDRQTRDLERPQFLDYLEVLTKLPANLNKKKQYQNKTERFRLFLMLRKAMSQRLIEICASIDE